MGSTAKVVRVGLAAQFDPHLGELVARLASAAGARLVAEGPADVWLVPEGAAGGATPSVSAASAIPVRHGTGPQRVKDVRPGSGVALALPADEAPLMRFLGSLSLSARARVVGLVGARGGLGASTLAAALARVAARAGVRTALADLDEGGGIELLLGIEHDPGPRWADLRADRTGFPADALSLALPRWNGVSVLSGDERGGPDAGGPGVADALAALASEHDLLVLDAPRSGPWLGPWAEAGLPGWHHAFVLAGCDVRSAAAAAVLARRLMVTDARLVGRSVGFGDLDPESLSEACGLTLAARARTERGAAAAAQHGEAPGDRRRGAVARTAAHLFAGLEMLP